jgi:putative tryptophan/tyrosine transport system substrate-binding protein
MQRRDILGVLGSAAVWPMFVRAQTPGRTYRVGYLTRSPRGLPTYLALLDELRLAGFTEGRNLNLLDDGFGVVDSRLATAAATLAKAGPDAIFASGFGEAKAAQSATQTIPILALSEDMIADGLVSSPAGSPTGQNIAGYKSERHPDRTAEQVRTRRKSEDRKGNRR